MCEMLNDWQSTKCLQTIKPSIPQSLRQKVYKGENKSKYTKAAKVVKIP